MRKKKEAIHFKVIQTANNQFDCSEMSPSVNERGEVNKKKKTSRSGRSSGTCESRRVENVGAKGLSSCEISRVIQSLPFSPSIHDQCRQRGQYSICAVEISASFKRK